MDVVWPTDTSHVARTAPHDVGSFGDAMGALCTSCAALGDVWLRRDDTLHNCGCSLIGVKI